MAIFDTDLSGPVASAVTPSPVISDQSLSPVSNLIGTLTQGASAFAAAENKAAAKEKLGGVLQGLSSELSIIEAGVTQGGISSARAQQRARQAFITASAANPGATKDLMKLTKDFTTSFLGQAIVEGTPQEQLRIGLEEEAIEDGFASVNATQEQRTLAVEMMQKQKRVMENLSLSTAQLTNNKAVRAESSAALKAQHESNLMGLNEIEVHKTSVRAEDITNLFLSNALTREEAESELNTIQASYDNLLLQSGKAGSDLVALARKPVDRILSTAREVLSGKGNVTSLRNQVASVKASAELMVLQDPTARQLGALSSVLGVGNNPSFFARANAVMESHMLGVEPRGYTNKSEVGMTKVVLGELAKGNVLPGDEQAALDQIQEMLNKVLDETGKVGQVSDNPKDFQAILDLASSEEFRLHREKHGSDPVQDNKVVEVLTRNYADKVAPLIRERWDESLVPVPGTGVGTPGSVPQVITTSDVVQPVFTGSGLLFKATSPEGRAQAARLNRDIAPLISQYIRAQTNLSGEGARKVYEDTIALMLGVDPVARALKTLTGDDLPPATSAQGAPLPQTTPPVAAPATAADPSDPPQALLVGEDPLAGILQRVREGTDEPDVPTVIATEGSVLVDPTAPAAVQQTVVPTPSTSFSVQPAGAVSFVHDPQQSTTQTVAPQPVPSGPAAPRPTQTGSVVDNVFNSLFASEGTGTNVTGDVATGNLGVTAAAKKAVPGSAKMTDEQIAKAYLTQLNRLVRSNSLMFNTSQAFREAMVDSAYNLGPKILLFKGLTKMLRKVRAGTATEADAFRVGLLDTATQNGQALRGLAKRRAQQFNTLSPADPIEKVQQLADGTIIYWGDSGTEVFRFKPSKGRHTDSEIKDPVTGSLFLFVD